MKKTIAFALLLALNFGFQSCQEEPKKDKQERTEEVTNSDAETKDLQNEFNKLMKESVAAHDEVMPKMGTINESLEKLKELSNEENKEEVEPIMEELKTGHEMMMSWMKGFGGDFTREEINQGISTEDEEEIKQKLELIKKHHKEAQEMKKQITKSLQEAEEFIEQA